MKITIFTLAAAISIAVFACSDESPNSSEPDILSSSSNDSSSSNGTSSSSDRSSGEGRACEYSGEDFGIAGLFTCEEAPSDMPDMREFKTDCEEEGGVLVQTCPSGEKLTCTDEEDEYNILYKFYVDGFTCGSLGLKNADGSGGIAAKGGACGPFTTEPGVPFSTCLEFPELLTGIIKLSCSKFKTTFREECPRQNADLICYEPEEEMIFYFYGEAMSSLVCEDYNMEEYSPQQGGS